MCCIDLVVWVYAAEVLVVALPAFFVAMAFGLLFRYREVSERIRTSTDIGRDLWNALELRMKKQDERILDVMTRIEVLQSRVLALQTSPDRTPVVGVSLPGSIVNQDPGSGAEQASQSSSMQREMQQPESREFQVGSRPLVASNSIELSNRLDDTQIAAVRLLSVKPMDTREITNALRKSREHTARIMKELFEMGLVARRTSEKPFIYELTEDGRRYASSEL